MPTSGTIRKSFNKYSNKSPTEKSSPRKVVSRPSKDSNTTKINGINRNGQVVYKPGLKQDGTIYYCRNVSTGKSRLQSLLEKQILDMTHNL